MALADCERIEIGSRAALREWLRKHHKQTQSVWLVVFKKGDPRHVPYADIVEEALCFGWIDSRPNKLDGTRSLLLLSPRKTGSVWSRINKERIARLIADGWMQPPGLAKIEAAKADGSWSFLDDVDNMVLPQDLAKAFQGPARKNFDAFPGGVRRQILYWIKSAKTAETRARRIAETADKAARNERANQYVPK